MEAEERAGLIAVKNLLADALRGIDDAVTEVHIRRPKRAPLLFGALGSARAAVRFALNAARHCLGEKPQ